MKNTWLLLVWLWIGTFTAFGQGTVLFSTRITPLVDAKIFDIDGVTPLSGSAFKAQIYGGPTESSLTPAGEPLPFRADAGAGYVDNRTDPVGGVRIINGVRPLQTAYVQVRAWDATKGSTYEAARDAGGKHGSSPTITLVAGGDLVVPANLVGLQGFKLQLSSRPTIVKQPLPVTTGVGGIARFEVIAGGSPPFTYQWRKSNADIPGARSATYEIPSVSATHAGEYSVRVSNSFGFVDSATATLTIAPVPAITEVLINPATPLLGRAMRLEVLVQGTGPITFQWRRNGSDIGGATQASFEDPTADPGTYSVRVTGPGGSIVREVVTVSPNYALNLVPLGGGTISATPPGTYQPPGTTVVLQAIPDNGYSFSSWSGAVSGTANPISLVMNDHKSVEAIFRPVGGTIYFVNRNLGLGLDARILDVDGVTPVSGPSFVAQLYAGPTTETLAPIGPTVTLLTGDAAGYFRGEDRSIPSVVPGSAAFVQIRAWDSTKGATFEAARLANGKHGANPPIRVITGNAGNPPSVPTIPTAWASFKLQVGSAPQIVAHPKNVQVPVGGTARFDVQATGSEPLTYQWFRGTTAITGANAATYEIPNVTAANEGSYSVRVSNSQGHADSQPATLRAITVYTLTLSHTGSGQILATPSSSEGFEPGTYLPNTVVTLQAVAEGGASFVRWEGAATGNINPTTLTLTRNAAVSAVFEGSGDGGTIDFRNFGGGIDAPVFDIDGTTRLSGPAFLAQLYAGPSASTLAPVGAPVPFRTDSGAGYIDNRGGSLRVVPTVAPGAEVTLQIRVWEAAKGVTFEAALDAAGKTGASELLVVIAGGGLATPALPLGLKPFQLGLPKPPAIRTPPQPVLIGLGGKARFEVVADGTSPLTYQWRKGTADLNGATASILEIPSVDASHAGDYSVRVTNPFGSVTSTPVPLTIVPPPVIANLAASPNPGLVGKPLRLEVTLSGTGPFTYQWLFNGAEITGATGPLFETPAAQAGTYAIRVSSLGGTLTRDALTVSPQFLLEIVALRGGSVAATPEGASYPAGTTVTLTATPEIGYGFGGWTGDASGSSPITSVIMSTHRRVEALFLALGGTVYFANRNLGLGIDAPVLDEDGVTRVSGSGYVAQLYAGPLPTALGPVGRPLPLLDGEGAGYFRSEDRSIATVPPGGVAYVQIRAWELAAGDSYEAAVAARGKHGSSATITVQTGNVGSPPSLPAYLQGITSFQLRRGSPPRILTPPSAITLAQGKPASLSVVAEADPAPAYQWVKDDADIQGATSARLEFASLTEADGGQYAVRVSNALGAITTEPVLVTVLIPPTLTILTPAPVVFAGNSAELAASATGSVPIAYQWYTGLSGDTSTPVGTPGPAFVSEPLLAPASFWVRATNAAGSTDSPTVTVTVNRRTQVITFAPPSGDLTFGAGPVALAATASSSLPVSFTLVSGPATLAGNTLTPTAAGNVVVAASQPGNELYLPAPVIELTLPVSRAGQSITFNVESPRTFGDPPSPLLATASSGLPVALELVTGPGSLTGNILSLTGVGTITVRASQPGDANHLPAPPVEKSIVVQKASAVLSLSRLQQTFDGASKRPDVTVSPPGLLISLTYDGSTTAPSAVGKYLVQATVDDPNYAGTTSGTLEIVADINLAGIVFDDLNGNGTREEEEPGLAGVTLRLLALDTITVVRTATTDAEGQFQFSGIATASYYLQEQNPIGYISTTPDLRLVSLSPGTISRVLFGDQAVATIAGVVFEDLDADGTRDEGEQPLPGVAIRLLGTDGQRSTTTAADGSYQFHNLNPGQYTVEETDPPGFFSTTPNLRNVNVAPGGAGSASFGDQAAGSVTGIVFEDRNGNGSPDEGETGIPNVSVRLTDATTQRTTRTDASGTYRFADIPPATYTVEEIDPLRFTSTTPNLRTVALGSGGSAHAHFGDQPEATVGGVVFNDLDGNGLQDTSESGLAGVVVRLLGTAGQRTTSTAADGTYLFANVTPGAYSVEETDPPGYTSSTPNVRAVSVASGGAAIASFGDQVLASISGIVFEDLNGNGSFDDGEPGVGGVQVLLVRTSDQANVGETTTASSGGFLFANIPPGSYEVRQLLPSGYTVLTRNTLPPTPSRHGAPASDSVAKNVSLAEGGAGSASFGINVIRTLSGMIFNDLDGNSQPSPDEPGIGGTLVEIRNLETDVVVASVTTAADGLFVVPGLATGSYAVDHRPIPGFVSPNAPITVTVSATSAATANFPVRASATASGRVFNDENGDGIRGPAEPGIGGARLTLHRVEGDVTLETDTATDGSFLLTGLQDGEWQITLAPLPGFSATTPSSVSVTRSANASITASFGVQSDLLRAPSITREPADLTLAQGASGTLSAEAGGTEPLEFRWLKNGTPLPGANAASLTIASATAADDATYQLRVRNAHGTTLSRAARVTVTTAPSDPYEAWATAEKLPGDLRLPGQDADADGVPNLLEFVLGTPPLTPSPDALPTPVIVTRNGAGFLGFEFRTRVASAARFYLETSQDLLRWSAVEARRESGGTDATGELIRLFDSESLTSAPFRFVRLGVALQTATTGPATLRVTPGTPASNTFSITLEGEAGRTYALEGSDDLIRWTFLQEVVATQSPITLTDDTLAGARYRFYRAVPR